MPAVQRLERIKAHVEESEARLAHLTAELSRRDAEIEHLKLACTCCDTIVQAPAASRPIERGIAGPGLLAHVLVAKFADHLPLYRQSVIYAREGVKLERSLLASWVGATCTLLRPLVDALRCHVFAGTKLRCQYWHQVTARRARHACGPTCATTTA